jgi:signal transduction histidine kinase
MRNWRQGGEAAPLRFNKRSPSYPRISWPRGFGQFIPFWPLIFAGVVGLLAMIATLQYRWTNEATNAERIRIGTELQSLMMKWHGDLFSEFSAICTAIQVGPDAGARDTWNDYMERYVAWNNALPHESLPYVYRNPDLIGEVYIWETNAQPRPQFYWLNLNTKRIERSSPPAGFAALLARLQADSNSLSAALRTWQHNGPQSELGQTGEMTSPGIAAGSSSTTGWQFDASIPAIVHPIFHHASGRSLSSASPVDWIVITLDMDVLRKRILPELAARYFGGADELDYRIAVIKSGSSPGTIYSSDPGFGSIQLSSADSTMRIFGPRSEGDISRSPAGKFSSLQEPGWRNFTGQAWFPVIQYGATPDSWLLVLQHRAGPFEDLLNGVKRNNLAISAVVLMLLAVNIGVLTYASYRAQNFAGLQMDFVASVSHELRTPLSAIFAAGENIHDGVVRREDMAHYGSIVIGQCRNLMNQVDRVLLFASIRSGKDRYTLRPLEVAEVLSCVRKNMSAFIAEQSCVIEERIESDLPPVLGDKHGVCSCLENLISNAVKYATEDRRIIVEAVLQSHEGAPKEIAISVVDHGMGIRRSELEQIFEPFYRSSDAVRAQIHGTGLGLSLAKHVAEAIGGRLTVSSEFRIGSIFTLYLPLASAQAREHEEFRSQYAG